MDLRNAVEELLSIVDQVQISGYNKKPVIADWFVMELRGFSSRGSTPLGQASSEGLLGPHSLLAQVLIPLVLYV